MSKFKKGDRVTIKQTLHHGIYYNDCWFNGDEGMYDYLGKQATIIRIHKENHEGWYGLNIDNNLWIWSDDMLEFAKKVIKPYGIALFLDGKK